MTAEYPRITIGIFISFLARGLGSFHSQIFCYSAISSAGIVGILPGYLICRSMFSLLIHCCQSTAA